MKQLTLAAVGLSGVTDTQVKWILEHRSDNPGIRDGDMFLANDPWVGAAHQQDVMLICPVFWPRWSGLCRGRRCAC